jgi:hypothetical protein
MTAKLDLPEGAEAGRILEVTYGGSEDWVEHGTFEGKLLGIKGNRLTIHFTYENYDDPPEETLVVNLETGMDETYNVTVTDIQLRPASISTGTNSK